MGQQNYDRIKYRLDQKATKIKEGEATAIRLTLIRVFGGMK